MTGTCVAENCTSPTVARTLCSRHHRQYSRDGRLDMMPRQIAQAGTGCLDPKGYRKIGQKYEHRTVMEQFLNRPLQPQEEVHHKNGQKADNRIENLEVWVGSQPAGQRPSDLARWLVEFHPEAIREAWREHAD